MREPIAILPASRWSINRKSVTVGNGIACLSVALVLGIRLLGWSLFGVESPYVYFVAALAVTAWYGGFGPGVLATVLSALCVGYLFLPPYRDFRIIDPAHIVHLCVFILTGVLISWLMGKLQGARARSEEAEREAELRVAEAEEDKRMLEALLEHVPEGVAIVDAPNARIQKVSKFGQEFIGRTCEAIEGAPWDSLLKSWQPVRHADGVKLAGPEEIPLARSLRNGEVITGEEWLFQRTDGAIVPLLCNSGPIRDKSGKIVQGIITWHDITERRRMELALRQTQEDLEIRVRKRAAQLAQTNQELEAERQRLFTLLDTLPFFVCLLAPDHSLQFTNCRFRALFPLAESRPSYALRPREHGSCEGCPACRALESNNQVKWEWTSSAGRHYEIYDHPFTANGHASLVLEIGIDITERRAAEQALQLERNKLLSILNSMREVVYIVNPQNEIEYTNPTFENEFGTIVPGRKCYQHLHDRMEPCPWCKIPEVLAGKSVMSEWISPANGRVYDVFDSPLVNHDGSISKLKIMHDVTERKRVQQKLQESQKQLQRLSSELLTAEEAERLRISKELHDELGQALTLIKLRIGLVDLNLEQHQQELKEHCDSASSHIDRVIDYTRRLSRDLCPAILEELGVTAALRRLVTESTRASNIRISADIADIDHLFSQQSCFLLYRIFQESLTNIMKHSGATEVKISALREDGRVSFLVQDNGIGMDVEEAGAGREAGGRGLGLAIMRERVRTLGAALEIWSRRGMGTRLSFSVPIKKDGGRQE